MKRLSKVFKTAGQLNI